MPQHVVLVRLVVSDRCQVVNPFFLSLGGSYHCLIDCYSIGESFTSSFEMGFYIYI